MLPLLIMQTNLVYTWCTSGLFFILYPSYAVAPHSYYGWVLYFLLGWSILLEPLSLFMYSWQFLDAIIHDSTGKKKACLLRYKNISLYLAPIISFSFYLIFCFLTGASFYCSKDRNSNCNPIWTIRASYL